MQTKRFIAGVALIMIVAVGGCGDGRELVGGSDLSILEGATLIDGTGGPPIADAALVLSGKHILRIGHRGRFRYPSGVTVQDMSGRWITPGFIDMHVHPTVGTERATMQMLLAFGVTTVRMPGVDGPDDQGLRLRDEIARGAILGPRVLTGGKFIDGPQKTIPTDVEVQTVAEMRAEVRRQAALGARFRGPVRSGVGPQAGMIHVPPNNAMKRTRGDTGWPGPPSAAGRANAAWL